MPQRSIALLERLEAAGFTDDDFRIIHHMPHITIRAHIDYCSKSRTGSFAGDSSTNTLVRQRLVLVAGAFFGGGFEEPARSGVFSGLASAALSEVPHT